MKLKNMLGLGMLSLIPNQVNSEDVRVLNNTIKVGSYITDINFLDSNKLFFSSFPRNRDKAGIGRCKSYIYDIKKRSYRSFDLESCFLEFFFPSNNGRIITNGQYFHDVESREFYIPTNELSKLNLNIEFAYSNRSLRSDKSNIRKNFFLGGNNVFVEDGITKSFGYLDLNSFTYSIIISRMHDGIDNGKFNICGVSTDGNSVVFKNSKNIFKSTLISENTFDTKVLKSNFSERPQISDCLYEGNNLFYSQGGNLGEYNLVQMDVSNNKNRILSNLNLSGNYLSFLGIDNENILLSHGRHPNFKLVNINYVNGSRKDSEIVSFGNNPTYKMEVSPNLEYTALVVGKNTTKKLILMKTEDIMKDSEDITFSEWKDIE